MTQREERCFVTNLPSARLNGKGALAVVRAHWGIYVRTPARRLKDRSRRLLELGKGLRAEERAAP